jgi:hypothetical protein
MSHLAIAAGLALDEISAGERLAAFSLTSYANREHRAWPGTRIAAARAGLSRSQFLSSRNALERRGLISVEEPGGGQGRAPVVFLAFAAAGARLDREINAPLFERTLGYSRARGSARLLLATLAALADSELRVADLSTEELCAAAGMADSTYRRARSALLAGGEVELEVVGGGRARTNSWLLRDPVAEVDGPVLASRTRPAPRRGSRPLVAAVKGPVSSGVSAENPVQDRTVSSPEGPGLSGVSGSNLAQSWTVSVVKGPDLSGVSGQNPGQDRTVSAETPPETPPFTPPPYARAGREPLNQSTFPPSPRERGSGPGSVSVVESYVSDRGRRRQRQVVVDLDTVRDQFRQPVEGDRRDWEKAQAELRGNVGESVFEVWLGKVQLAAVDPGGCLVLLASEGTRAWVRSRFARVFDRAGAAVGRRLRLSDDREVQLLIALALTFPAGASSAPASVFPQSMPSQVKEAV